MNAALDRGSQRASRTLFPVALAVAAGLVLGKPAGILAFAWLAVRLGLADHSRRG